MEICSAHGEYCQKLQAGLSDPWILSPIQLINSTQMLNRFDVMPCPKGFTGKRQVVSLVLFEVEFKYKLFIRFTNRLPFD